jgi:hypothetical protein
MSKARHAPDATAASGRRVAAANALEKFLLGRAIDYSDLMGCDPCGDADPKHLRTERTQRASDCHSRYRATSSSLIARGSSSGTTRPES